MSCFDSCSDSCSEQEQSESCSRGCTQLPYPVTEWSRSLCDSVSLDSTSPLSVSCLAPHLCPAIHRPLAARWVVGQKLNCEDLLLNWVAAEGIRERYLAAQPIPPLGQPQQAQAGPEHRPPHVVWVQPSRRLDISLLSGLQTGISRRRAAHEGALSVVDGWRVAEGVQTEHAWRHVLCSACHAAQLP